MFPAAAALTGLSALFYTSVGSWADEGVSSTTYPPGPPPTTSVSVKNVGGNPAGESAAGSVSSAANRGTDVVAANSGQGFNAVGVGSHQQGDTSYSHPMAPGSASSASLLTEAHLFLAIYFLRLFGNGAMWIAAVQAINLWYVERRPAMQSYLTLTAAVGILCFASASEMRVQAVGWRQAYTEYAYLELFFMAPLGYFFMPNHPEQYGEAPDGKLWRKLATPKIMFPEPVGREPSDGPTATTAMLASTQKMSAEMKESGIGKPVSSTM
ncbi:unnamed protein product, partial [Amoebophrya sp. A25]|eukprot:GSA25T00008905001.1